MISAIQELDGCATVSYETDGAVIKMNFVFTTRTHRFHVESAALAMAYKYAAEQAKRS